MIENPNFDPHIEFIKFHKWFKSLCKKFEYDYNYFWAVDLLQYLHQTDLVDQNRLAQDSAILISLWIEVGFLKKVPSVAGCFEFLGEYDETQQSKHS